MPKRPREELEERLVTEYLRLFHSGARHYVRVRLGPYPAESEATPPDLGGQRLYTVVRHWADGVAVYPDRLVVIEAKIKLRADALGQILINRDLIRQTPEFEEWKGSPIDAEVVYSFPDPETLQALESAGVHAVLYCPAWARDAYLARIRREFIP